MLQRDIFKPIQSKINLHFHRFLQRNISTKINKIYTGTGMHVMVVFHKGEEGIPQCYNFFLQKYFFKQVAGVPYFPNLFDKKNKWPFLVEFAEVI